MLITTRTIRKWYRNNSEIFCDYSNPHIIDETELQPKTEIQKADFEEIHRFCVKSFCYGASGVEKKFIFFGERQFCLYVIDKIIREGDILKVVSYDEKIDLSIKNLLEIADSKKVLAYLKQQYALTDIANLVQNAD